MLKNVKNLLLKHSKYPSPLKNLLQPYLGFRRGTRVKEISYLDLDEKMEQKLNYKYDKLIFVQVVDGFLLHKILEVCVVVNAVQSNC